MEIKHHPTHPNDLRAIVSTKWLAGAVKGKAAHLPCAAERASSMEEFALQK